MTRAQFITLQGDQFLDEHGEPFFPMIMSYYVDYFYTDNNEPDPYPTPAQVQALGYGRSSAIGFDGKYGYPSTEGPGSILQDLAELKAQGFNTLRFVSNAKLMDGGGMGLEVKHHDSGQWEVYLPIEPPYLPDIDLNPTLWFHYQRILDVCSLAQIMDMKVLLEPFMNNDMLMVMPGDAALQDHVALLASLAAFIHANQVTNLLAYELFGEPTYGDWSVPPVHTKAQICEIARAWNRALKDYDPDHLTTIGGVFFDDVFREGWDPLLLEVDFASMHPYPIPQLYEWMDDPQTHLDKTYERYLGLLYWYDRYLTKPYIISETGFQGENPFSHPSGNASEWLVYPYGTLGDEEDQDDFLRATLPVLKGSRCAGYGWWLMQNTHWDPEPGSGPDPPPLFDVGMGRYYGLLRYGEPTNTPGTTGYEHLRKTAAETLVDWATTPPADANYQPPASLDMGHRYYNPYMHPVNTGITWTDQNGHPYYGTLTGQVVDQFDVPVAGAVVKGLSYVGREDPDNPLSLPLEYAYYTVTDLNGYFELRAYDPEPNNNTNGIFNDPLELGDRTVTTMTIGAHGSAWTFRGWDHVDEVFHSFQADATYVLNSMRNQNDLVLDDLTIWWGESESYKALNTITAHEVSIVGEADMHAQYSVAWKTGFHAVEGSEVHAYVQPVHLECEDIAATDLKIAFGGSILTPRQTQTIREAEREVDITFHVDQPEPTVQVYPNPGRTFHITLTDGLVTPTDRTGLRVVDDRGSLVVEDGFVGPHHVLYLGAVAPGRYTIHVWHGSGTRSAHPVIVH
jgi:hypothetical protein